MLMRRRKPAACEKTGQRHTTMWSGVLLVYRHLEHMGGVLHLHIMLGIR